MSGIIRVPKLDYQKTTHTITRFIRDIVNDANAEGVVIGLSGGVDSSLVAALCANAVNPTQVHGLILPTQFTPSQDTEDALNLGKQLGITTQKINIHGITEAFLQSIQSDPRNIVARANLLARIRMTLLYYYANTLNYLVAGTGDRSEELIGYFTKYGDGGVDFLPISHLYKTQVRALALHLEIPPAISEKPSSPQLYPGHLATDEIPLDYDQLDPVLVGLIDLHLSANAVSELLHIPQPIIQEIHRRYIRSAHKRTYPPMLSPPT